MAQDDDEVTRLALDHLKALGHRRIAHVGGERGLVFEARRNAYSKTLTAAGQAPHIVLCDSTEEGGYRAGLRLLDRPPGERPTAIYAASDLIALGVMSAAAELGIAIQHDISLVGVDNTHLAKMRSIRLTSADLHPYEQGRLCGDILTTRIADPDAPATYRYVESSLCIRDSTGAPQEPRVRTRAYEDLVSKNLATHLPPTKIKRPYPGADALLAAVSASAPTGHAAPP